MEITYTLNQLPTIATQIIASLSNRVLLFHGKMGVGKTTLIKQIAEQLGVEDSMSSPTFSLVNEYKITNDLNLYHFDFYRIESEDEAFDIGIEEYFESPHWKLIEWPEKIKNLIPNTHTKINITENLDKSRTLNITMPVN
ncbi:tRNA (adenosine(37)-N6)-threonylcarbamoyltransferase complex ATPase subunit type 1 TsaE [Cochleicola gelatinilyticus]|uniref:tRNA threonylcarbamoyladenosine biosynthesis protein TsaE n=1 Tax=Cochleicola gelatinilyticus TaxID=1763537 RepID=A0A167H0Q1_9FLAO|nr:tRNA (adenosine(37)-N6)-threonylcarbamoyltransferase complex ATPase subunit type 1 TsaE [Cochleicola gelatinilyticus]OAB78090.1 tRNA threonylcarbamoyladenosine biosynthesis protein TsaE [Cochleicola gelatinilyticus]